MLADDIEVLTARIEKLRSDEAIASEAKHFETRAAQIEQLANDLRSATKIVELFRNNRVNSSVPSPPTGLISFAESMKRLLENDRASVVSDTGGFGQKFKTPLEKYTDRAKSTVTSAWEKHVDKSTPNVNEDMLSVLIKVKGFADSVSTVRKRFTEYRVHRTRTPTCADDICSFDRALEELRKALGSLGSDDLPEEVVNFMRRAGLQGVPLDELSEEIRSWLFEHELLGRFVIKTG